MKVSLAEALGTCFGVQDAIDAALDDSFQGNLTIIGELVHNPQTLEKLRAHGVHMVSSADDEIPTKNVMITAHGAPRSLRARLEERGHTVYDASCPLVLRVHTAIRRLIRDGYYPVVVGQRDHVEVRGIVGDLDDYEVVGSPDEIDRLEGKPKLGIVSQTTQQIDAVESIVAAIRDRFPDCEVRFLDTVCKPTKDRQVAVRALADRVDLMIVVGGRNSSNTKKLKKVCDDRGLAAHHITGPDELEPEWFEGREHVGITAGTSTPHDVIADVEAAVRKLADGAEVST